MTVHDTAQGVRSTGVRLFAWIEAHQQTVLISLADGTGWTVRVSVWTFVRSSAARFTVGRADVSLRRTVTLETGDLVDAKRRSVADLFGAKVHSSAASKWVAFKTFQTAADGRVLFRAAVGVLTANRLAVAVLLRSTGVDALVVGAHLIGVALVVCRTLNRATAESFIIGIAKVPWQTLANRLMAEHFTDGVAATDDIFASILAVVETSVIRPTGEVVSAFIVVVATVLNSRHTAPLEAGVVGGAVAVNRARRKTLSVFALFICVAVSGAGTGAATVVVHEAELRRGTALIGVTRQPLSTAGNRVAEEALSALARVAVSLGHAEGVVAAGGGRQADIDALVVVADVRLLSAVVAGGALHLLAAHQRIAVEVLWTAALRSVQCGDAGGVHAADGRVVAAVATLWSARHLNAGRGVGTVAIAAVADV